MATLYLIPRAPASVTARPPPPPPPSTSSAFVPPGCRQRHRHWPSLKQQQQQPGAIRPCLVVRAHICGGGALPAWPQLPDDRRYFVEERKRVMDRYNDIVHTDHGCLYMEAIKMSGELCLAANQALTIASQIMRKPEGAKRNPHLHRHLRGHNPHDSPSDAADAVHGRTVSKNTATSFLGALRGLASVSHILLDAALDALGQTRPRESLAEYALNCDVEAMRSEFGRQMDGIEDGVGKVPAAETWCKVVMPGILEATRITGSLVRLMVARRERALASWKRPIAKS